MNNILFLVEGKSREPQLVESLNRTFFRTSGIQILSLPAGMNLYMLYSIWKKDEFQTDIIELVKEYGNGQEDFFQIYSDEISELYLFFDFDAHHISAMKKEQHPLEILQEMLQHFDNETENGKLYISYPMVEAIADHSAENCRALHSCTIDTGEFQTYKMAVHDSKANDFTQYDFQSWKTAMNVYLMRVSCLFGQPGGFGYENYRQMINPYQVFEKEKCLYQNTDQIFSLSAFPAFLFDYYRQSFLDKMIDAPCKPILTNEGCKYEQLHRMN